MEFNAEPYYDDFESENGAKDNNYMRILFRPGYAVQARELTQIQSILQNQIKQFGDHIFKDGSPVYGGHISLDTSVDYVILQTSYDGTDIDPQDFSNKVIFNQSGSAKIRAKVISVDEKQTYPTLMVRYLRGTKFPDANVITTSSGSVAQLANTSATGTGSIASIDEGVFYVNGFFVQVASQSIVLDAYNNSPSYKIGLEIEEQFVDESTDANLLDPAQNSFNYQAPGATRYQFALNLAKRSLSSTEDSKFFELLRVENGTVTKRIEYPIYSEIEKTLARRTYDESGDYIIRDFEVDVNANTSDELGNADSFILSVGPGKAYVKGFEYESISAQPISVNRAREKATSTQYDLSLEYGNYLYVKDVLASANGLPNTANLQIVDLHCVSKSDIKLTSAADYNSTYMGSARVTNFDRESSSEYLLYMTDINFVSNTFSARSTSSNSNSIMMPLNVYSNTTNAYANVSVKILSGPAAGDVRRIVSYTHTPHYTAFVDPPFTAPIGSGNNVALLYSSKNIDSVVIPRSDKAALNFGSNVSSSSIDAANSSIVYDTNLNSLLFKFPENYIANSSITNADYIHRKLIKSVSFTGTSASIILDPSGNETFPYGSDGNDLSALTTSENIIVVAVSGGSVGTIITPTSVSRVNSKQLTINYSGSFTADVYVTVKVSSSSGVNRLRTKTARGNSEITTMRTNDSPSVPGTSSVIGASTVKIDSSNGFVWFTDASVVNKTPGGNNSLYISDVYNIVKVFDSGDPTVTPSESRSIDITDRYYLDSNQTLSYYDHSRLVLRPGYPAPRGQILAVIQYYEHSSAINGYFDVDSYPSSHYANGTIPTFITSDGASYNLRDCIDFRITRDIGTSSSVASYTFIGAKFPKPTEPMEVSYDYYLPRLDKIILTKDRELQVLYGNSEKNPKYPIDTSDSMTLFTLQLNPYTANLNSDIKLTRIPHKRYTMKDIGNLESRIQHLEFFTGLSLAEKQSLNKPILYEDNATQKEKYGVLVDNFKTFSVADHGSADFQCAISDGMLQPQSNIEMMLLNVDSYDANVSVNKKTISLKYTEVPAIEQLSATSNTAVTPYIFGTFKGTIALTPQEHPVISLNLAPKIVTVTSQLPNPTGSSVIVTNSDTSSNTASGYKLNPSIVRIGYKNYGDGTQYKVRIVNGVIEAGIWNTIIPQDFLSGASGDKTTWVDLSSYAISDLQNNDRINI